MISVCVIQDPHSADGGIYRADSDPPPIERTASRCEVRTPLQGYLAHKKPPPPLGSP
ncbi:hypothetical protein T484DRAFT_1973021 [Baffinella frigidus]|nr:hypothetical protein T484DRAFT_1973021 [Cryptophyta sp. CCMP2293]